MGKALSSVQDRNNHTFHITSTGVATPSPFLSKGGQLCYYLVGGISGMELRSKRYAWTLQGHVLLSTPAGQDRGCHSLPGASDICRWSA